MNKDHTVFPLDVAGARVLALLQVDAPEHIAEALDADRDVLHLSPPLVAILTGRSERSVRDAFAPRRPGRVGKVKRYVSIAAVERWSGTRIGVAELGAMLERVKADCSHTELCRALPEPASWSDLIARDNDLPPPGRGKAALLAAARRRVDEIDQDIASYEEARHA